MAVSDLHPGDRVEDFFCLRKLERRDYSGGERLVLEFGDASGRVDGVMWDGFENVLEELTVGGIVKVRGSVGTYRDQLQIRVDKIRAALDDEVDPSAFVPHAPVDPKDLADALDTACASITNPHIKALLSALFDDAAFRQRYLTAPGGKLWHHNAVGGLAEHSLNMVRICEFLSGQYPHIDRDLLICGALIHDIGKVEQYEVGAMIDYSDEGRLVGHINSGDFRITTLIRSLPDFPAELERAIRHLIVSHQGEFDHGSPVVPQMPEAFLLYYADEIDSKMGALRRVAEKTGDAKWSEWVNLLGRFVYFGHRQDAGPDGKA